jgi:queuine/archaeosine tRNA-ribosyltransferase
MRTARCMDLFEWGYMTLLICYSVDTCTGLLPENKPRYVMGVVSILSNVLDVIHN